MAWHAAVVLCVSAVGHWVVLGCVRLGRIQHLPSGECWNDAVVEFPIKSVCCGTRCCVGDIKSEFEPFFCSIVDSVYRCYDLCSYVCWPNVGHEGGAVTISHVHWGFLGLDKMLFDTTLVQFDRVSSDWTNDVKTLSPRGGKYLVQWNSWSRSIVHVLGAWWLL